MNTPNGKFALHIKPKTPPATLKRRLTNPNNAAEAQVARKRMRTREEQLKDAVNWCQEHNKKCICENEKCDAIKLKECSSCHDILRSGCSKSGCIKDGKKPIMITVASAKNGKIQGSTEDVISDSDTGSLMQVSIAMMMKMNMYQKRKMS